MNEMVPAVDWDPSILVGLERRSAPFTISDEDALHFEDSTHLTAAYGDLSDLKSLGYVPGMVEGFHSLALVDAHTHELLAIPGDFVAWNYGLDRVRFLAPVTTGAEYQMGLEIREVKERAQGWTVHCHCRMYRIGNDSPVMVADWIVIMQPRGARSGNA